ncbi:hypothetical protein N9T64_00760 [Pelagibacteraceae bacterium]|nr:hypothetical protein [Pelagibacteraceae bacterium]
MSGSSLLIALVWMIFFGIIIFRDYSGHEEGSYKDLRDKWLLWLFLGLLPVIGMFNYESL